MEKIYSFVFRGLLTEEALDRNGRKNPKKFSSHLEEEVAQRLSLNLIDEEYIAAAREMSTVFTAITAFENSVRELVSKRLLEEKKENWWEESVSEKIRKKAESRRDEESKTRWHTPRGETLIHYTDFGDLVSIIQNNWLLFEDYFPSVEWARQILMTLEYSRNVIMHSGQLGRVDIERIVLQRIF
ncbi:MAG: hypothetical protein HYR79_00005 [Nitrospirae bacterium]|nr:hypothetical protein [Nitrospirota bacterium]